MTIECISNPKRELSLPVFLLKDGEAVERHQFFSLFSSEDQRYITAFATKAPVKDGHTHLLFTPSGREAVLMGVAPRSAWNHRRMFLAARRLIAFARREKIKQILVHFDDWSVSLFAKDRAALAEIVAIQFEMANFEFTHYKTPPAEGWSFVERIGVFSKKREKVLAEAFARGKVIGEEVNSARVLSNTPAQDLTPQSFAREAKRIGKAYGIRVSVLGKQAMEKLGMGGIIGVGKGSMHEPQFIIMEYLPVRAPRRKHEAIEQPIVLVGKGVTFDTGGLNLKPEQGLLEMHMDMSGGAAVLHTIATLARLKVKKNIVALIPVVENMTSGSSYHPGDLLRTMSGKTIEVLNTDAEGRIILADALTYAKRYNPRLIVDVATLTGAAEVALGKRASALFTNDRGLEKLFRETGERTGDFVWPLPLWEEYGEDIKGTFGDLANVGKGRVGGAITGAMFLWEFVKDKEAPRFGSGHAGQGPAWVHLDIAPRMVALEGEYLAKGAVGASISLLTSILRKF